MFKKKFFLHLLAALVLTVAIAWIVLSMLASYTRHGEVFIVPDFSGKDYELVVNQYGEQFSFIVSDSLFKQGAIQGSVLQQEPPPGSKVKRGRNIYLITVSRQPEKVRMPNLVNLSLREALVTLESAGLEVNEIRLTEHFARNAIVAQTYHGKELEPETMIYRGVAVDLLIGDGGSVINNPFPMIYGKKPNEVKHLLHSNALNIGKETYLDVADSTASRAYKIEPYFKPGEAEAKAYQAGNDVIEYVTDVGAALNEIKKAIGNNQITSQEIDSKCRKVLALKYWAGLSKSQIINKTNISGDLNSGKNKALIRELYANALTLLKNDQNIIPIKDLQKIRIATISINRKTISLYQKRIADYQPADNFCIDPAEKDAVAIILKKLAVYDIVVAGVYGLDQRPNREYGIKPELDTFLEKLTGSCRTIITWFGNPYAIDRIESLRDSPGLLLAYQENDYTEDLAAQLIFGGIGARGSLPVTINQKWPNDFGLITPGKIRVQYGYPESAGMSSDYLENKIDSVVNAGIALRAFPGCEVMAARKGIVVFRKTYGYQTYENRIAVNQDDLYDLASVTKISATIPAFMLLDGEGKFSPDKTLGEYLPFFKRSNKGNILMSEILTHQAGFVAWIPYWKETVKKNGDYKKNIYRNEYSERFPEEVADGLYITDKYKKRIFAEIKKSPVSDKKFLYSDLGFIISPDIIENITGEKWYDFVSSNIYNKIGARDIRFNPIKSYPLNRIVPTEFDSLFRKQQLQGTVHDEGAAMFGGISGHAGLFATANDLMKLMEMYRRMGSYGGEQIIKREVLERYTSVQFPENGNRRGLGFDKPLLNNASLSQKDAYPAKSTSPSSFGHSGYTGTFVWVDPENELSYIFLSNRVYPTRNNTLISDLNIRTEILQVLYDSIIK